MKFENEALRLELEDKCKALNESLNENVALKLYMNEKLKHNSYKHDNKHFRKKHVYTTYYSYCKKGHIAFYYSFKKNVSSFKKVWVSKSSHVLTNHQGPIKVWVPKSSI